MLLKKKEMNETGGINIGIITVMDRHYHPNRRLIEAGKQKGHRVDLIHPYRVWPGFEGADITLVGKKSWRVPDVILPRQGATIGESCLSLIEQFSLLGVPVVNGIDSIRLARNQFFTLQAFAGAGIPFPDTIFINAMDGFYRAVERIGGLPVVVKQISGRQGKNIFLINNIKDSESIVHKHLDKYFGLLVQRFIPTKARKDIRVLMVGREIIGVLALKPKPGDFRANFHLTGNGESMSLTPELGKIARQAADAVGLEIAGIDLMLSETHGVNAIEVNYAPGFRGMEAITGVDVASKIVNYVKNVCAGV